MRYKGSPSVRASGGLSHLLKPPTGRMPESHTSSSTKSVGFTAGESSVNPNGRTMEMSKRFCGKGKKLGKGKGDRHRY
jgi:hypothetical protein